MGLKMLSSENNEGFSNPAFENRGEDGVERQQKPSDSSSSSRPRQQAFAESSEEIQDHQCSFFGCFKLPGLCQRLFLRAAWILVFLSWAATIQGMVINGFVNVVISTLERRFGLRSTETGLIAGSYDIGSMLSVIPITYFGGRIGTSKPRYIAVGLLLMGCGSLMFAMPHFVTDDYLSNASNLTMLNNLTTTSTSSNRLQLCDANSQLVEKNDADKLKALAAADKLANYKYFFIFGQILHGVGAAPLVTLGTTLLDESVSRVASPMYIGIFQTFFVVGPAIGYLIGGSFLEIYTDFNKGIRIEELTSSSQLWVGAWWLGFAMSFLMSWSCALLIGCYPAVIPQKAISIETSKAEGGKAEGESATTKTPGYGKLSELPRVIWTLLTNPTYMMINIGGAADGFTISGLSAFLPKFMQSQYGFTAGIAAAIVGVLVIPAGGLGTFSGGYIAKRFKLTRSQVIKMYIYCQLVTIPCSFGLLFYCQSADFAGVNIAYPGSNDQHTTWGQTPLGPQDLTSECNRQCKCDLEKFTPFCSSEANLMFFSPCLAGCLGKTTLDNNQTELQDCQCLAPGLAQTGKPGRCFKPCSLMPGFFVLIFISIWFTFMSAMPNVVATLRAVEPVHRSLALGIESIILRLIGTIPGPVFFGYIIDRTCLLSSGNCLFYDNYSMALSITLTVFFVKIIGVGFFGLALYFSNRSHIKDEPIDLDEMGH